MGFLTDRLYAVDLPGRAGELQRQRSSPGLVREAGDNYGKYHDHLAAELAKFGERPTPDNTADFDEYREKWAQIQAILYAEAALRQARAYRQKGRPLDGGYDASVPIVDDQDRLVSASTGRGGP
jgi:hypothetical protein